MFDKPTARYLYNNLISAAEGLRRAGFVGDYLTSAYFISAATM